MNRSEIVSLLQKNIDELVLITKGFAQMDIYPQAILDLARNKTADINQYIEMLEGEKVLKAQAEAQAQAEVQAQAQEQVEEEAQEEAREEAQEEVDTLVVEKEVVVEEEVTEESVEIEEAVETVETEEAVEAEEAEEAEEADMIQSPAEEEQEEASEITMIGVEIIHPEENDEVVETGILTSEDEKKIAPENQKAKTLGEKLSGNHVSRNDALNKPVNGPVHSSISNLKISDIRQAISLGDRFRFQRELFRNNGEEMNKMLSYLNMLATYEEAVAFLFSKYGWDEESPAVNDFLQIIKRKF
jgi:hypothetical protein